MTEETIDTLLSDSWAKLAELERLGPGWDSYDAEPIAVTALEKARLLLTLVRETLSPMAPHCYQPWVIVPMVDGGVQLEWRREGSELEIEVGPSGAYGYLLIEGDGDNRRFKEGDDIPLSQAVRLVEHVALSS